MMNKEALQYLAENLTGFHEVEDGALDIKSQLLCVASGAKIESLERFQDAPNRIEAAAQLQSCESFCDYVNRFKDPQSTVYLDLDKGSFSAVLDHHGADAPAWRSHTARFTPKKSLEWEAWTKVNGTIMSQIELALFIEQMLDTISEPEPNVVLKAALDFQANENLVLGSTTNLDDGATRFTFNKDNVAKNVTFPHRIKLSMPVHENEASRLLDGRVRFRVGGDGGLKFVFTFVQNPRAIERRALNDLSEIILTKTEGLPHYHGGLGPRREM